MKYLLCILLLCVTASVYADHIGVYEGPWKTTNPRKKLNGVMKADVTKLDGDDWQGRFWGIWQGVSFDYTVKFNGKPLNLTGTAVIDGADYEWTGELTKQSFKVEFTGSRYDGSFDLKRKE